MENTKIEWCDATFNDWPMPELRKGTLYMDAAGRIQPFQGRERGSEVLTNEAVE